MQEFASATRTEKGCIYYGWDTCGDKLFCREAYVDGDAVNAHLANVGPLITRLLDGPAKLDSIEIHGPAAELEKTKAGTEALGTKYFVVDSGLSNMVVETGEHQPQTACTVQPYFTVADWAAAEPRRVEETPEERMALDGRGPARQRPRTQRQALACAAIR